MTKLEIRKKFRDIRKSIKPSPVTDKFFETKYYSKADKIFTFVSYGSEIDTIPFIKRALKDSKIVAVPVMRAEGEMIFIEIDSLSELIPNRYGIPEPEYNKYKILVSDNSTLIAVPGLAFDKEKYRIGYGGGYYDRYLSENIYMTSAGLCYEAQLTDRLPREKTDIPVDIIATEGRII